MPLKYKGQCMGCHEKIEMNEIAEWSPGLQKVRHIECGKLMDQAEELKGKAFDSIVLGKFDNAKNFVLEALKTEPGNINQLFTIARNLSMDKQYEKSIIFYDIIISKISNSVPAFVNKGVALHRLGRYGEAISHYEKALQLEPNNEIALKNKLLATRNVGKDEARLYGEDALLEYKETFRYNAHTKNPDPILEEECAQAICAFMNTAGGTLQIGIANNGDTTGLESDYLTLPIDKRNEDNFELVVRDKMEHLLTDRLMVTKLKITFPFSNGKKICNIEVPSSNEPIYVNSKKDGQIFLIRDGNRTIKLISSEMVKYCKEHFS